MGCSVMGGTHALLSASSATRWMHCPPSARLTADMPDTASEYAEEGTAAHYMAQWNLYSKLRRAGIKTPVLPVMSEENVEPGRLLSKYKNAEMEDYVDLYTDLVMERVAAMANPYVMLEQRLDYSEYVPGGFGTGDVVAVSGGTAEIIDLKYGKGIEVSADHNPQLMLYGVGALCSYDMIYDIDTVRMTIIQPRLDSISTFEMRAEDLRTWAAETVAPLAKLADSGDGDYAAGDWCRFCRASADCRARADLQLQTARNEFSDEALLSPEDCARIYPDVEAFMAWAKDFIETVKERAVNEGLQYPGYKVVEGRSKRIVSDENTLRTRLHDDGFSDDQIMTVKLNGLTALERLIGKKRFAELADGCIEKPPGKPAFVPEDDPRPALSSIAQAQADFEEED